MGILADMHIGLSSSLLDRLLRSPPGVMIALLSLLRYLGGGSSRWRGNMVRLKELVRSGHPFVRFLRRLETDCAPRCRKKLVSNLIVRGLLANGRLREAFMAREGFLPPYAVSIAPTSRCNLSCPHCSSAGQGGDDLDPTIMDRVMREARDEMGVHFFILTGGEPFVYRDIFTVMERFPDCYFQVFTNGTLLDDARIARFAGLGNVLCMLSVEGDEAATDRRRRDGAYAAVGRAMQRLRSSGIPFGYSVMETRENVEEVTSERFIDWALERGCLVGYYFHYMPVGPDADISLLPTPRQRDLSRRNVYRWRNEKPIFLIDVINDGPLTGGCTSSGRHYVHILSSGDVTPCVYSNFSTHNIRDVSLTEALKGEYLSTLRRSIPFEGNMLRPCLLLDRPRFFFRTLERFHPRSCIPGEEETLRALEPDLKRYADGVREIYDGAWERGEWESVVRSIRWRIGE
jgi:MoaA/NifB/PqqE/SkfB family radical SAM enzyme